MPELEFIIYILGASAFSFVEVLMIKIVANLLKDKEERDQMRLVIPALILLLMFAALAIVAMVIGAADSITRIA